jgi:hypothetical protein
MIAVEPTSDSTVTLRPVGAGSLTVHGSSGVPAQLPLWQTSSVVHESPSSHGALFGG